MSFKKITALLVAIPVSLAGCVGIGPNATYYMGTTSFNYDPSYNPYMIELNGSLYTTNFIGPLSYQAFSFLKLRALS